jgi:N-acetylmuramoyl-L-alanine amidase
MTVDESYPASPANYSDRGDGQPVDLIVLHTTDAPGAPRGTLAWGQNPASGVSWHYLVTQAGLIYRCVPEEKKAWHAGAYNRHSIGIEIEGAGVSTPETWTPTVMGALIELCADICTRHGFPPAHLKPDATGDIGAGITGHMDLGAAGGNHHDPGDAFPWYALITGIVSAMHPKES